MFEILAAQECSHVMVPEASELAMQYYRSGNVLWIVDLVWSFLIPLLFLFTGLSGRLGTIAKNVGKKWYFSFVVFLALFIGINQLISFPLDFYEGYIREHQYGLSTQTFARWLGNFGKGTFVLFVTSSAFLWIFYLLVEKSPKRWWFYGSLAGIAFLLFSVFIKPIWVDPLFHHFGPMKNQQLEQQILNLASQSGIEGARVFEVDMSRDTTLLNAYVTGFGSTKRIVLWDTTIEKLTPREILFVMGHEMGHYVLHHIWSQMIFLSAMSFLIFYLVYRSSRFFLHRYQKRFGFSHLYQFASLPLFLLMFNFFDFLSLPLTNWFSRYHEHEADRFGLEITRDNEAAAKAFIVLQQQNLANPRPGIIYTIWQGSHPSLASRIEFCNSYCPWKQNEPLKYTEHFERAAQAYPCSLE